MKIRLIIKTDHQEIKFYDLDEENEVQIRISDDFNNTQNIYIKKENLISLSKHIKYLLDKMG